ncbi:MAG: LD-carboxypeptidase [Armatimonadetes bacterium]|nr:LD-carboxypeptidase [Armatimonadota bacterium]
MSIPQRPFLLPRPLPPAGTIGIVSPAGSPSHADLDRAVAVLTGRGYRVRVGEHAADSAASDGFPYLAGSDADRAADVNEMLSDPAIDLVLCARGGYGCARVLPLLDYDAPRRDPKPVVGYSDITALSLALAARAGVASFSGIMATAGDGFGENTLDPFSEASFWQAVGANGFRGAYAPPTDATPWTTHRAAASGADTVTGAVFPVCLSLLTSLVGTSYLPDLRGAILVIEDVHEELYAVDRMLTQLRQAGLLADLSAVLIGSFTGTTDAELALLVAGVPRLVLKNTPPTVAVASGVAYGHIPRRLTLPVGVVGTAHLRRSKIAFDTGA